MKLIVGLGNPGQRYERTRHNLGFLALDALIEKFEPVEKTFWEENKDLKSQTKKLRTKNQELLLIKPTTFMNASGEAVSKVLNYYKIPSADMIVIYDDMDLPFGKIRIRFGGSAGGHHGVESIIEAIKTDRFLRIRLGIGRSIRNSKPEIRNSDMVSIYILSEFSSSDRGKVKTMLKQTINNIELILSHGIEKYMSRYNK